MKYSIPTFITIIFINSVVYAQAVGIPKSHNQLTGTGTISHTTLDSFYNSQGQANGIATLDASGNVVQGAGTVTLSGGYVKQTNGTATGTQLTSVQINSGTATLSGIASPYISQTNGTATGLTLSGTNIINGITAPYISQNGGTGTVSGLTSTGNVTLSKDGQNRIIFYRNTIGSNALPLSILSFYGSDTVGAETNYANIDVSIGTATNGQESGKISLWTMMNGAIDERLSITGTSATFGGVGNKVDVDAYGTITARDGIKFSDNSVLNSGNIVKGIVAGSGISVDQSTGTVTITNTGSATAGGWMDGTNTVYVTVPADQVIIGSTTAASNQILTVVGSATASDMNILNKMSVGFQGTPTIAITIGDNDTGIIYPGADTIGLQANGATTLILDGTTNRVRIGTSTSNSTLQVGGTITASGFSGNGAGLTNISTSWSGLNGNPTDNGSCSVTGASGKIAVGSTSGRLDTSWMPLNAQFAGTQSTFGTTTQFNNSVVTIFATGTSPLSVVVGVNGIIGTNTTTIMTGTSTPAPCQVLSSGVYSGNYHAFEAFDGVISGSAGNGWAADAATGWIEYDYGTGTKKGIADYRITANVTDVGGAGNSPNTFDMRGSNDRITYVSIDARTGQSFSPLETKIYTIATSTTKYQFYKLNISSLNGGANVVIGELQLIGVTRDIQDAIFVNASGTVFVSTTTPNSTSTAYAFQVGGSGLATSWGVTCYEAIKSIVGSGSDIIKEGYDAVMGTKLFKHHPKIRNDVTIEQAEELAKREYTHSFELADYETFKNDKLSEYLSDKGTDTANWERLRADFESEYLTPREDEFYVLGDKDERIRTKKVELESDTSVTVITPVSDDPSTPSIFKRNDNRILDLQAQIGALQATAQYQDAMLKNLEKQINKK